MRISLKTVLPVIIILICTQAASAQNNNTTRKPGMAKFKPPKLYTFLGAVKDSVNLPLSTVEHLVALPLKIVDDKKAEYKVSSYQFLYRKKTVTEDEQTGKVSPASSIVSNLFKNTPLPEFWVNQLREQLKAGEELYFFDVVAKDAQGRVMYASNLKIVVQ